MREYFHAKSYAFVFIILQIIFTTRAILKIREYPQLENIRSHDTCRPIALERRHLRRRNTSPESQDKGDSANSGTQSSNDLFYGQNLRKFEIGI